MSCATLKRPLDSDLFSPTGSRPSPKRRKIQAQARALFGFSNPNSPQRDGLSPFPSFSQRLSPEQMQIRLRQEIRHLRRLKQLQQEETSAGPSSSGSVEGSPSTSLGFENFGEALKAQAQGGKDAPLFTFKQVGLICERMLQEKEEALRREYEQVLSTKLAEQYDTFVKFTHDQIQRRFEAASAPSYLS